MKPKFSANRCEEGSSSTSSRSIETQLLKYRTILSFSVALCVGNAAAGTYRYTDTPENEDASKIPVCQDFMENLRRLGNPPMVCDRKFHSTSTQFAWPKWQSINPAEHRDLVEQIWQQWYSDKLRQSDAHEIAHLIRQASFEKNARSGDIKLAVTQVPIDGDMKYVLRFIEGDNAPCKPQDWSSTFPLRQHYIVDSALQKIDFTATNESALRGYYSYVKDMRPDLFLYRGKPFVAAWYENGIGRGHLEVFGDRDNYCFIDYTSTSKGEIK